MKILSYHGDGGRHREWTKVLPTSDAWTFLIPAGSLVQEASGATWSSDYPVVAFFWPDRYYQVFLLLKSRTTEYYCNIITPPVYRPGADRFPDVDSSIEFFDLDLDIYVSYQNNQVQIKQLDEDEFEQRQVNYTQEWIVQARLANEGLKGLARASQGPFSPATARWWRANTLGPR